MPTKSSGPVSSSPICMKSEFQNDKQVKMGQEKLRGGGAENFPNLVIYFSKSQIQESQTG